MAQMQVRESLPFDRRRASRRPVSGEALAIFTAGAGAGSLARVALIDASESGVAVRSPVAVEPGAAFSLMHNSGHGFRQTGLVVRCEAIEGGYRLGLRGRSMSAAA